MSGDVCVVVGADCIADFTMHMITSQRITRGLKVMGVVLASRSCCVGSSAGRQREVILKDFGILKDLSSDLFLGFSRRPF